MVENRQTRNRDRNRARQRQLDRQRRRGSMVSARSDVSGPVSNLRDKISLPDGTTGWMLQLRDAFWHLSRRIPVIPLVAAGIILFIVLGVFGPVLAGRIGHNVWSMNQSLSGLSVEEATEQMTTAWIEDKKINVVLEGEIIASVSPLDMGISLNAGATAEEARNAGIGGLPFGVDITPVLELDEARTQSFLLSMVDRVYVPPFEAGYSWENNQLLGLEGRPSRELDVNLTMTRIQQDTVNIARNGRLDLLTFQTEPATIDPSPYAEAARQFITSGFRITGYDPFTDTWQPWSTTPETLASWLAATNSGLTLREDTFELFVDELNRRLGSEPRPRYINETEIKNQVRQAILSTTSSVDIRVRYQSQSYTLASGDWGQRIARKTGLPFGLIDNANPGLNWNALSVGQTITLPSRDALLQKEPVPHKRIVVDLDLQWLVAYENGEVKFSWPVAIGRTGAPTYPGIFQILSHEEVALGSGYSLCNAQTCGQWKMNWFMGIYEVVPGLMNGFHGGVLLPNGSFLGGGSARGRTTFGCVMSEDPQAEELYQWAEIGTVVEILSSEFPPQSELGRQAQAYMQQNAY